MENLKYRVIFNGEIIEGEEPEKVKNDIASLLKINAEK
jgi:uncharacterized protein YuzB (UPF0349 family)